MCTKFWPESLMETDHMENLHIHIDENNIKTNHTKIGWEAVGWINVTQDSLLVGLCETIKNLWIT
jgi:hypothetical protein